MTHAELVERAGKWLRGAGCSVVFEELHALTAEVPDAIGWRDGGRLTYLIECKASRGDFLADAKKAFRAQPEKGMGCYRYYMCPPGMIRAGELPERWGLLYAHDKKVTVEAGRHPRVYDKHMAAYYHRPNRDAEATMLVSALNRLRLDLGDRLWRERVQRSYMERQNQPQPPRRFVFID